MNIKLDKDIRIRLDQEDVRIWNAKKCLEQKFKLGLQSFTLELKLDSRVSRSHLMNENSGLVVVLGNEDSVQLCDGSFPSSGIVIDDITIQIDKWNTDTRKKYENLKKP